jgi:hypothetical protein
MSVKPITIENFKGWLNLSTISDIGDNQFQVALNMFYNSRNQIQTRYGMTTFGNTVGTTKPITSYHFFQRDDTGARQALCTSGTAMYKYDEWTGNWNSIKSGLTEFETATGKTTWRTRWDFAVYKNTVYCTNWVDDYAEYDGTTYTTLAAQPKVRYINMNTDTLYGSGQDTNPSTVYYSAAAPANGRTINTSAIVVWGDELGRINGLTEYWQLMLAFKSKKIYSIDIVNNKAQAIDSQTGWYSDRSIQSVGNSIVYLSDRGVDTLKSRNALSGYQAIESAPLDQDVEELTRTIRPLNANANCWLYIGAASNYYFSFSSDSWDVPWTTLVYNAMNKAWTQYNYPSLYDYWFYIDSDWVYHYLVASATTDQMYEIETWFTDLGELIAHRLVTKAFDLGMPWVYKTHDYVDLIGEKSLGTEITVVIEWDWEVVWGWTIDDDCIMWLSPSQTLGTQVIGTASLTGDSAPELQLYNFSIRIPLYTTNTNISADLSSLWGSWTLNKMRIWVKGEPIDVIGDSNIIK